MIKNLPKRKQLPRPMNQKMKTKGETQNKKYTDRFFSPDIQLDDLFKKTKTTPALYWSPLSDAQVQARDEAREERRKQREQRRKER